jgi:hypothetical protein
MTDTWPGRDAVTGIGPGSSGGVPPIPQAQAPSLRGDPDRAEHGPGRLQRERPGGGFHGSPHPEPGERDLSSTSKARVISPQDLPPRVEPAGKRTIPGREPEARAHPLDRDLGTPWPRGPSTITTAGPPRWAAPRSLTGLGPWAMLPPMTLPAGFPRAPWLRPRRILDPSFLAALLVATLFLAALLVPVVSPTACSAGNNLEEARSVPVWVAFGFHDVSGIDEGRIASGASCSRSGRTPGWRGASSDGHAPGRERVDAPATPS